MPEIISSTEVLIPINIKNAHIKQIVYEGTLVICEIDGGYQPPDIWLNWGQPDEAKLNNVIGDQLLKDEHIAEHEQSFNRLKGRWRITVEKID